MKSKLNVVQSLKLSKMPVKGSSLSQPTASKLLQPKTDAMHKKQQPYQNSSNTNSTKLNLENLAKNDASFGMKREDSAYCSSTSSTVSSQEVEICNKISDSKIGNQSNSVNYKTGVQSDSNEQNNNSYDEQKFQSIENDNDIISEKGKKIIIFIFLLSFKYLVFLFFKSNVKIIMQIFVNLTYHKQIA